MYNNVSWTDFENVNKLVGTIVNGDFFFFNFLESFMTWELYVLQV